MALPLRTPIAPHATPGADDALRAASAHAAITPRPRVASNDILRGSAEVEIDHRGTLYRLRVTSLGKLILTK
jgi:hemin uptake protein HemP